MSLIPEKPLIVSPSLAATLGLEEAVLLQALGDIMAHSPPQQHTGGWHRVSARQLTHFLPFWNTTDLQRIASSLRAKGVLEIDSAPMRESGQLSFSVNSASTGQAKATARHMPSQQAASSQRGSKLISGQWTPCNDTVRQLSQYNIPQAFIERQIPEFVTYWSERGEPHYSWSSKFIKRVLHAWRDQQQQAAQQGMETLMDENWRPSHDALEILTRQSGIGRNFCEDAIPEFVLYWQERGERSSTWNSRFIQHVKRQWARYKNAMEHDTEPRPLTSGWQPSESLFEVLSLANIPRQFARQQVAEFVLYWQESGQASSSWNTKFLQQVKRQWARQLDRQQDSPHERQQNADRPVSTRHRSLEEDLSDRSWAQ